jgi:iron(III) transport system substrate-binding protein
MLFAGGESESSSKSVVNVYSHRHYEVDSLLFSQFTRETGIEVNVVNADADELIQRLRMEGRLSPADLLLTADVARLVRAQEDGLLQKTDNGILEERIPSHLRDPEGYWFGLTRRARVIVYHKERVDPAMLSTYEDLTGGKWKGKIAIRSSANIYNQSLLASIIANNGAEYAERWAEKIVANMARDPQGNDRDQMKAIAAGQADIAVVNTYYVGRMLNSDDPYEVNVAEQLGVFFPDQEGRGTHVNISGAGITAHAPNKTNAERLLEFLTTEKSQRLFAEANYEYPVVPGVPSADIVSGWGDFREDALNLSALGRFNGEAVRVFDRAGWK